MDTSSLTNLDCLTNVKILQRSDCWFQKYDHCLRFVINEASCMRGLNHAAIDKMINLRRSIGGSKLNPPQLGSWYNKWQRSDATDQDVTNLHFLCDFFQNDQRDFKLTISRDNVYVYTTDPSLVQDICNLHIVNDLSLTKIQLTGTPGTVILRNPQHQYRSYFRSISLKDPLASSVKNFLQAQEDIQLSPSLQKWTKDSWKFTMDYYFIDHNEHSTINMLRLFHPKLIRKTVSIVDK